MAISRTKQDAIVDAQIDKEHSTKAPETKTPKAQEKKPGFFKSTITELKKVEWPGAGYVARWTGAVLLFTVVVSLFLGFVDNIFTGGLKFIDCTTELTQEDPGDDVLRGCTQDLFEDLTFRS